MEALRLKMYALAAELGLGHPKVLECSRELDRLINLEMGRGY